MKTIFYVFALLCAVAVNAQDHPGENVELFDGKELTVMGLDERGQDRGYPNFYTDETLKKTYKRKGAYSKYDALVGRTFKVVSYKPIDGTEYALQLNNKDIGTLFYKYSTVNDQDYYFEAVGGLNYPEDFFCNKLRGVGGKYTDEVRSGLYQKSAHGYKTPPIEDIQCNYYPTQAAKYDIHISLTEASSKKETNLKGVTFILDNNSEVIVPEAIISVTPSGTMYRYGTIVNLNDDQLIKLQQNKIVKIMLATHEKQIKRGNLIQHYLKCFGK